MKDAEKVKCIFQRDGRKERRGKDRIAPLLIRDTPNLDIRYREYRARNLRCYADAGEREEAKRSLAATANVSGDKAGPFERHSPVRCGRLTGRTLAGLDETVTRMSCAYGNGLNILLSSSGGAHASVEWIRTK